MAKTNINRDQRKCVLCRYWNGAIGSNTIWWEYVHFRQQKMHSCFKKGRGMQMTALQECSYCLPRYSD